MDAPRILVVDDEALLAMDISERLEEMQYCVVGTAASGEDAVLKAIEEKPDLVLMDICLHGTMGGIRAAQRIKDEVGSPVVFISAFAENVFVDQATLAEPYGFLVKPIDTRDLRATIQIALYKARMEAERDRLRQELQAALSEVKMLREFIPICAWCSKVRNDEGYWASLESYLAEQKGTQITHAICPSCAMELAGSVPENSPADTKER